MYLTVAVPGATAVSVTSTWGVRNGAALGGSGLDEIDTIRESGVGRDGSFGDQFASYSMRSPKCKWMTELGSSDGSMQRGLAVRVGSTVTVKPSSAAIINSTGGLPIRTVEGRPHGVGGSVVVETIGVVVVVEADFAVLEPHAVSPIRMVNDNTQAR